MANSWRKILPKEIKSETELRVRGMDSGCGDKEGVAFRRVAGNSSHLTLAISETTAVPLPRCYTIICKCWRHWVELRQGLVNVLGQFVCFNSCSSPFASSEYVVVALEHEKFGSFAISPC